MYFIISLFLGGICFQGYLFRRTKRSFSRIYERWKKELSLPRNLLLSGFDAAKLLDQQLAGEWSYDALRRLGIVAPLLGVISTAFLFVRASYFSNDSLNSGILGIYCGVGFGAFSSAVSQGLLFFIHRDWVRFRSSVDCGDGGNGIAGVAAGFSSGLQLLLAETQIQCEKLVSDVQVSVAAQVERNSIILEQCMKTQERVALAIGDVFSQQLSEAIKRSSDVLRATLEPYERTLIENHCTITASMAEVKTLHAAVASTLSQALIGGESLARLSQNLDAVSSSLTATFDGISKCTFPEMQTALGGFSSQVSQLAVGVVKSSEVVSDSTAQFGKFAAGLAALGAEMMTSAGELRTSSGDFGRQCREMVASQREVHSNITENLETCVGILNRVVELDNEIASALHLAREGSGAIGKVTSDMKAVSGSFEKSVKDLAESGLPRALDLMNGFTSGVIDLRTQVQNSTESLRQVTHGFGSLIESLSESSDRIHKAVISDIDGLRESSLSLKQINAEILDSLGESAKSTVAMQSVASNLTLASENLAPALEEFSQNGIPNAQRIIAAFSGEVMNLSKYIQDSSDMFSRGFGGLGSLVEAIEDTRSSLVAAAEGVHSSSTTFSGTVEQSSTLLLKSAELLGEAVDQEFGDRLVKVQRELATGLASAAESAKELPTAIQGLSQTLDGARSQIDSVGSVSSQVSNSVSEMLKVAVSLKSSIDEQTGAVANWRAILDAIPHSLQVRTDNSVKTLVAHLAEITAEVGKLVISVRDSR